MREYLFKANRIDNGEEVIGSLLQGSAYFKDCAIIVPRSKLWSMIGTSYCDRCNKHYDIDYEVIPETIRQFTGLLDKNDTLVFEGDICSCFCNTQIFVVKYCQDRCGYFFDNCVLGGRCEPCSECLGNLRSTIEVIGNIYDNPELLEVKE